MQALWHMISGLDVGRTSTLGDLLPCLDARLRGSFPFSFVAQRRPARLGAWVPSTTTPRPKQLNGELRRPAMRQQRAWYGRVRMSASAQKRTFNMLLCLKPAIAHNRPRALASVLRPDEESLAIAAHFPP
jgi:hypothetical protein